MKLIIEIPDELFSIFKKHGINAFDYFDEYDKDQIAIAIAHGKPYEPIGDCISREALKEAISTYDKFACLPDTGLVPFYELPYAEEDYVPYVHLADIVKAIDNAPPVPQVTVFAENADEKAVADMKTELQNVIGARPKGEWIDRMADKGYVECPFCHKQITGGDLNFCIKCGADMRKGGAE